LLCFVIENFLWLAVYDNDGIEAIVCYGFGLACKFTGEFFLDEMLQDLNARIERVAIPDGVMQPKA
jgi:hypothetical protein